MKKLFFSAIACIAFAGSAFASNEVVSENEVNGTPYIPVRTYYCTVHVQFPDGNGGYYTKTFTETYYFVTKLQGDAKCNVFSNSIALKYNASLSDPFIVG